MSPIPRLFLFATVVLSMHSNDLPAGDGASSRTIRQGTVADLGGYSLAVERVERIEGDEAPPTVRLTLTPEPGREWAASGVFAQGEWLVLHDRCFQLARLESSEGGRRASVLLKGPHTRAGCGFSPTAVPLFAGETGSRIGQTRLAMPQAPASSQTPQPVDLVLWPSQYTLASSPEDQRRHQRLAPEQTIDIDGRAYVLSGVHPRGEDVPAYLELEPRLEP